MLVQPGSCVAERFEIEGLAGSGGMGTVFRARDLATREVVALKVIRAADAHQVRRFRREARALSELRHPRVVRYVAHGETASGEPYLVMEWLEGETLAARLRREPLSMAESLRIARSAAEGLAAAHARGLVHRDIKPANLFLVDDRPDLMKILDFGVVRFETASIDLTRTAGILGTPGYMAPEQARGEVHVDARADVFSLGLVLYECLAGRPAFAADHPIALLAKLVFEEPPRLAQVRPDCPPEVDAVLLRMLAKDKEARLADGAAAALALAEIGEVAGDAEQRAGHRPAPALTGHEQQLFGVVLADFGGPAHASGEPDSGVMPRDAGRPPGVSLDTLRPHGASAAWLADGTAVIALGALGVATDLAAQTARCALDLRARYPDAVLAVAMGRARIDARSPTGEAIDRAATLLVSALRLGAGAGSGAAIPIDDLTAGLLGDRFDVRDETRGRILVGERPRSDAPDGPASNGAQPHSGSLRRRLPFVGRERELALLEGLYIECAGEMVAHAVLITAPAGAGKSRLVAELIARLRARGERFDLWAIQGDPMSASSPLALIESCVRRAARVLEGEPLEARQQKLRDRVARQVPASSQQRVTEFLGELVRTPFPDDRRPSLRQARAHATLMADEIRRAWEDFVEAACAEGPLVIVVEDVQWADFPSVKYLDAALRKLARRPLLVLAAARPEVHETFPRLWSERDVTELKLHELRSRAAEAMVRAALGPDLPAGTMAAIVERAGGNAFYLEELIRAAVEGRSEGLPGTVLAMVQARLGALPPAARAVLRAASVFGEVFWRGGVEALLGAAEGPSLVDSWLTLLEEREIIARRDDTRFPGEPDLSFRHALLRDGAYGLLTEADRALGHSLAGGWLEAAGEADAMILASHYELGGNTERALRWCLTAAEQAFERDDLDASIAAARRGLRIGTSTPLPDRTGGALLDALSRVEALATSREKELAGGAPTPLPTSIPESFYRFDFIAGARVFHVDCGGRWSKDFARQYVEDFKRTVAPLLGHPWGKLININLWLPTEPDAAEAIIDFLRWAISEQMVRVAYVLANPSSRLQARRIIETSNAAVMSEFFATEDEGLEWLRQCGL